MRIKANRKFYISFQNIQLKNIRSTPLRSARQLTDPTSLPKVCRWVLRVVCLTHHMQWNGDRAELTRPGFLAAGLVPRIYYCVSGRVSLWGGQYSSVYLHVGQVVRVFRFCHTLLTQTYSSIYQDEVNSENIWFKRDTARL